MLGARPISLETVPINRGGGCAIGADELAIRIRVTEKYGSSGQFVGGCEPVRAWVPVDLWITSLLPTGPTGQAGDLWTTSLLPTESPALQGL